MQTRSADSRRTVIPMPISQTNEPPSGNCLRITGEVVEILDVRGTPVAKILLKSCSVEVPLMARSDVHLGDCVEIETEWVVRAIRQIPSWKNSR